MNDDEQDASTRRRPFVFVGAAVLGVLLGWAGARPLSGLAVGNVVLWAVAVVVLGLVPGSARAKSIRLGTFGFALGLAFMCFGYAGEAALVTRVLPFALIGVFCALCAIALGGVVHLVLSATRSTP
jgi:hypothetical protein